MAKIRSNMKNIFVPIIGQRQSRASFRGLFAIIVYIFNRNPLSNILQVGLTT